MGSDCISSWSLLIFFTFHIHVFKWFLIGLDSYSRQVFIYLDPVLIYISLWIDCLFEIRKIAVFLLAFIAGWLQGHWWGFISRNYIVWPTFLLMNVFIALKGSHFWFLAHLSRRLTRWAYSIAMVRRPSVVVRRRPSSSVVRRPSSSSSTLSNPYISEASWPT